MPRLQSLALRRLAAAAVFIAALCGSWARGSLRQVVVSNPIERRTSFDAAKAFAELLPSGLVAPALEPGLRLVSVATADIDADGDLDVIASTGSVDLLVWINDGTGRLAREFPSRPSGWIPDPPGPSVDDRSTAAPPASGSFGGVFLHLARAAESVGGGDIRTVHLSEATPPTHAFSPQAPRAPPVSFRS